MIHSAQLLKMAAESEEQICKKEVPLVIGGEEISVPTELLEDVRLINYFYTLIIIRRMYLVT